MPDHMILLSRNLSPYLRGYPIRRLDDELIHIMSTALFNGMFETIRHDMPREKAMVYMDDLRNFYSAGWFRLLGIPFE